jgi:hypothetical protein
MPEARQITKKGFATVYDQCLREVKEKLENSKDWETTQKEQCLHILIQKIKQICIGFDDHKQDVYKLVQALKGLFLYSQLEKELVEEYRRNLKCLQDTIEAFGGSPGLHKGMVDALMKTTSRFTDLGTPTKEEMAKVENKVN